MCDSRPSSVCGSLLKKSSLEDEASDIKKEREKAPFIYLVKKSRCRPFEQCVTFVFK